MIVNNDRMRFAVTDLLLAAASLLYVFGIRYWFPVCAVMEGNVMTCHWAGETLKALSLLLLALSFLHVFLPEPFVKIGLDLSAAGLSVLMWNIPGRIIPVCGGAAMRCRALTKPWTAAFCAAVVLFAAADLCAHLLTRSGQKHHRQGKGE